MDLLPRIERYLRRTKMKPAVFGRAAVRDPRFVFDLRMGREPRIKTMRRVHAWLDDHGAEGSSR